MLCAWVNGAGLEAVILHIQDIRDLIKRLLAHNPTQRLGSGKGGAADVKAHPWFTNFDWAAFAKRQLKAPYEPQARSLNSVHGDDQACMLQPCIR